MSLPVTNTNLYFKIIIIKTEENHDIQEKNRLLRELRYQHSQPTY